MRTHLVKSVVATWGNLHKDWTTYLIQLLARQHRPTIVDYWEGGPPSLFPPCPILHKLEGNRDDLSDGFPEIRYGRPLSCAGFLGSKPSKDRRRRLTQDSVTKYYSCIGQPAHVWCQGQLLKRCLLLQLSYWSSVGEEGRPAESWDSNTQRHLRLHPRPLQNQNFDSISQDKRVTTNKVLSSWMWNGQRRCFFTEIWFRD